MKKIPCKTCPELSWTSSEGFSYRVKIRTSALQSLKTKEITMMPVKPLKNYYPNHKYTHINAFSSLKITTVASMKPSSMQNLIQLFVRTGYLSGIKTTLSCPSETRSSCRPWVTAVWIIAGPVTSLSELGDAVWGLKNTFLYVWLIFHLVVSTWACSTQAVWTKQVQHSLYMSLWWPLQLCLEVRNGGSHLCCSSHEMGGRQPRCGSAQGEELYLLQLQQILFLLFKILW